MVPYADQWVAAMEEGRDGPSEAEQRRTGCMVERRPQWRRAEMGPRRRTGSCALLGHVVAAMEEGRDGPSEA